MDELALHEFVDHRRERRRRGGYSSPRYFPVGCMLTSNGTLCPIVSQSSNRERHADMAGDGVDVDRRVGRAADRAVDDDDVFERFTGNDVGRLQVLPHHLDDPLARLIGDLAALAVGPRDRRAARQAHAERFGERIHGRGRAHGVAVANRGRGRGHDLHELFVVDLARREIGAGVPHDDARSGPLAVVPAVEHRAAGENDSGNVDRRRRHDAGRRRLVAAGRQHHAVDEVAHQDFDQAEIGEIAVERRGRPLACFLNWVHRKLERQSPGRGDPVPHALGEFEVMTIAGRKIGAGLRDADDRLAGAQLAGGQAEIEVALEIKGRHARVVRIVEPEPGPQWALAAAVRFGLGLVGHRSLTSLARQSARALTCQYAAQRHANQRLGSGAYPASGDTPNSHRCRRPISTAYTTSPTRTAPAVAPSSGFGYTTPSRRSRA